VDIDREERRMERRLEREEITKKKRRTFQRRR
jgi:hypothetical protein